MKLQGYALAWGAITLLMIFAYIRHQNQLIQLSFTQQRLENELAHKTQRRDELMQQKYTLQRPEHIKKLAQQNLGMIPIPLKNMHAA